MIRVTASRWPWQWYLAPDPTRSVSPQGVRYGWSGTRTLLERFGGGWRWKFGIAIGGKCVIVDLLFGSVRIVWDVK